jgi:hypothetical protein
VTEERGRTGRELQVLSRKGLLRAVLKRIYPAGALGPPTAEMGPFGDLTVEEGGGVRVPGVTWGFAFMVVLHRSLG